MKSKALIAAAGALLLIGQTAAFDLPFLGSAPAFAEKGGNGGGNSGGKSGGNSNSSGKGNAGGSSGKGSSGKSNSSKSSSAKSSSGKSTKATSASGSKAVKSGTVAKKSTKVTKASAAAQARKAAKAQFTKNVNAELKALNSLKRNINGLMNSSSPKFAAIRAFVQNYAGYELAKIAVETATATLQTAKSAYDKLVTDLALTGVPAEDAAALQAKLDALNAAPVAEGTEGYAQWRADVDATTAALATVTAYQTAVSDLATAEAKLTEATAGTSEADLVAALSAAANPNSQPDLAAGTISPEALARAKDLLGFEDANGLIDDYVSQITAPETTPDTETPAEPVVPDTTAQP